jgi:nitrogen fixation-related uncharacterized protein
VAVWIFFRMSDSGQFDDPVGPAHSVLMDDDTPATARAMTAARPVNDRSVPCPGGRDPRES